MGMVDGKKAAMPFRGLRAKKGPYPIDLLPFRVFIEVLMDITAWELQKLKALPKLQSFPTSLSLATRPDFQIVLRGAGATGHTCRW